MAESSEVKGKFPDEVVADDDVPKPGFYRITVMVPGMKTSKGVFDKVAKVTNGKCEAVIKADVVSVEAQIDGNEALSYVKKLPEKIIESKSKPKLENGQASLILAKAEKVSWGPHWKYFIKAPEAPTE